MSSFVSMKLKFKKLFFAEMTHITKQLYEVGMMDKFFRQGVDFGDQTAMCDVILVPE